MKLDFTPLDHALESLAEALQQVRSSSIPNHLLRDGLIQRFEYSFELSWKMMKRQLQLSWGAGEDVDLLSKKDLFRQAAQKGLLKDPEAWFSYLTARNLSSHSYDDHKALEVAGLIPDFLRDAQELLRELKRHNAGS